MLGQEPRQTTSNLGALNKPSIQVGSAGCSLRVACPALHQLLMEVLLAVVAHAKCVCVWKGGGVGARACVCAVEFFSLLSVKILSAISNEGA
jgi:hypothetical protein